MIATALAWWSATGLIAYLDGRPRRTFGRSLAAATVVLCLSLYGVWATRADVTVAGAYLSFASALGAWAWLELTFLMGYVTGPRRTACPHGCGGLPHFRHAVEAILWHELAVIAVAAAVVALTWHAPNPAARLTFLVLWVMRTSAKLNLFLGVRNLGEAFLPEHLRYLLSFFRRRALNPLFPLSIVLGSWLAWSLVARALAAPDDPSATGYAIVATLAALAMLEHWLMVLPLPPEALWRWSLGGRAVRRVAPPLRYAGDAPP